MTYKTFYNTLTFLKNTLLKNGYPIGILNYHINNFTTKRTTVHNITEGPKKKDIILTLQYLGQNSYRTAGKLQRIIHSLHSHVNLKTIFTSSSTLCKHFLYKDKLQTTQRAKVVYKFSCLDCDASYIGKTKRTMAERKNEHFKALTEHSKFST